MPEPFMEQPDSSFEVYSLSTSYIYLFMFGGIGTRMLQFLCGGGGHTARRS